MRSLLANTAQLSMVTAGDRRLPLHLATSEATAQLLLAAAPATAMVREASGRLPVGAMLQGGRVEAANTVLPVTETRAALAAIVAAGEAAVPLFADVACQRPLLSADWQLVSTPCPGLGAALPVVVCRSRAEAGQLAGEAADAAPPGRRCASPASCLHPCVLPSWCMWCKGRESSGPQGTLI